MNFKINFCLTKLSMYKLNWICTKKKSCFQIETKFLKFDTNLTIRSVKVQMFLLVFTTLHSSGIQVNNPNFKKNFFYFSLSRMMVSQRKSRAYRNAYNFFPLPCVCPLFRSTLYLSFFLFLLFIRFFYC